MAAAILTQGLTDVRSALSTLVTQVVLTDDNTAFSAEHTGSNPGANKSVLVKAATDTVVNSTSFDSIIAIDGNTEMTGKQIFSIGVAKGTAVLQSALGTGTGYGSPTSGTDTISRTVRTLSIGVQSGDVFNIGIRSAVSDTT